jgi:hypothetical protein
VITLNKVGPIPFRWRTLTTVETPRTVLTVATPSTRETIDLVSDDEEDLIIQKRKSLSPPFLVPPVPVSITTRKRIETGDNQDETPSRPPPPPKKQKFPTAAALPVLPGAPTQALPRRQSVVASSSILSPQPDPFAESTFTQIPDSEGEDNDNMDWEEDFNSDDILLDTKELLVGTDAAEEGATERADREDVIVPESPVKTGYDGRYESNVNNRLYPTITSSRSITANSRPSVGQTGSTLSPVYQVEMLLTIDDTTKSTSQDP